MIHFREHEKHIRDILLPPLFHNKDFALADAHTTGRSVKLTPTVGVTNIHHPFDVKDTTNLFLTWGNDTKVLCNESFVLYGHSFVYMKNVLLDKCFAFANATGGEEIESVINRKEADEVFGYEKGFFQMCCPNTKPNLNVTDTPLHLGDWFQSTQFLPSHLNIPNDTVIEDDFFTIALTRYEYANVYWTVMDIYDTFITMRFFNLHPSRTKVLWIDAKSTSALDNLWTPLFGSVERLSQQANKTLFKHLAWEFFRGKSPMLFETATLPLIKSFRHFVLSRFGIPEKHTRDCSSLEVLFIWRRNYVAHHIIYF